MLTKSNAKRPYLVIRKPVTPIKGVNTCEKGWMENTENYNEFDRPELTDRLTKAQLEEASIIIDIVNSKVVKNRFGNPDSEIIEYYLTKYSDDCKRAVSIWLDNLAKKQAQTMKTPVETIAEEPVSIN